jgi:hypothetical protein
MSLKRNSWLLGFFCLIAAANALADRPRVLVSVEAIVPPFTEHWTEAHLNAKVREDLTGIALEILSDQFRFLQFGREGDAAASLHVALVENDKARGLRVGERPWILQAQLTTAAETRLSDSVDAARSGKIRTIPADTSKSAEQVEEIFRTALERLAVDGRDSFVRNVLGVIHLADTMQSFEPYVHVLISVPYPDLHATTDSKLLAKRVGGPEPKKLMGLEFDLQPIAPAAKPELQKSHTDCAFVSRHNEFSPLSKYAPYINNPKKSSTAITMDVYRRELGTPKTGNKQVAPTQ